MAGSTEVGCGGITFGIKEEYLRKSSTGDLFEIGNISIIPFSLPGCPQANSAHTLIIFRQPHVPQVTLSSPWLPLRARQK